MRDLLEYFEFYCQYLTEKDSETVIAMCLIDFGFPFEKQSYKYIKAAVTLLKKKPDQLLVYELYPDVAKQFPIATKAQVEIAIRREISRQWKNRDAEKWNMYFPNGITKRDSGPTNAEFLLGMFHLLVFWENYCKNYRQKEREQLEKDTT